MQKKNSFYNHEELNQLGFRKIGINVKISRLVQFYGIEDISIGDNVRIDDFSILSGNITLNNNIHISAYSALYGGGEIYIDDYSGLSPRCTLFSATDDFSGNYLIGPHINSNITNVKKGIIRLNKYCQLGANTVVMPNVDFGEGSVTGVMSFVKTSTKPWCIYAGSPAQLLKKRSVDLLNLLK